MIISTVGEPLEGIMRDFKKFTSKKTIELIDTMYESRRSWMLELFGEVADGLARVSIYQLVGQVRQQVLRQELPAHLQLIHLHFHVVFHQEQQG